MTHGFSRKWFPFGWMSSNYSIYLIEICFLFFLLLLSLGSENYTCYLLNMFSICAQYDAIFKLLPWHEFEIFLLLNLFFQCMQAPIFRFNLFSMPLCDLKRGENRMNVWFFFILSTHCTGSVFDKWWCTIHFDIFGFRLSHGCASNNISQYCYTVRKARESEQITEIDRQWMSARERMRESWGTCESRPKKFLLLSTMKITAKGAAYIFCHRIDRRTQNIDT